ncbi:MAG: hypothetical protein RRC07_07140 [Anaerolineae bacterium]|nr:hypothetical protein [Anaerolineae bacterium]
MSVLPLKARLLGEFQLYHGETPLGDVLSPRLQSLLAYILVHRETSLSRQQLAFVQAAAATDDPVEQARLTGRRVAALNGSHRFQEAEQAYQEAMSFLDAIPTAARDERAWHVWLDLQFSLLDVLYFEHNRAEMPPILAAMAAPLEAYGTPRQRSQYAHFRARMKFLSLSFRFELDHEAVALAAESLHWAQQADDDAFIASQTFTLGFALLWAGQLDAAIDHLRQAATRMETLGIVPNHSRSLTYLGIAYRLQGDAGRVQQLLEQHDAVFAADANPHYLGVAAAQRARRAWRAGDRAAAAAQAQADLVQWGPLDQTAYPIQWLARLPLLASALETGESAAAREQAALLLSPHLQGLAGPVEDALRAAVAASSASAAGTHLQQACRHAQEHGYL